MQDLNILVSTAALVIILAAGWFLIPFGLRRFAEARLRRLCRKQRAIVLSYDDGPSRAFTPQLLDLLQTRNRTATFFVIGQNLEANGDVVARAIVEGHEVGSHTFNHRNAWKVNPLCAATDLAGGIRTVHRMGGDGRLFRPPYGKQTLATLLHGLLLRQRLGWWTIDCKDTWAGGDRWEIEDVLAQIDVQEGGVVLIHDSDTVSDPDSVMPHAEYVLTLTAQIIEFAEKKGYRMMRLGDVLEKAV